MELWEGQCSHKTCTKGDNDTSSLGTTAVSKWQCEKKSTDYHIIEPMSNKILPVRSVNPSETFQFQAMLKYFIFS